MSTFSVSFPSTWTVFIVSSFNHLLVSPWKIHQQTPFVFSQQESCNTFSLTLKCICTRASIMNFLGFRRGLRIWWIHEKWCTWGVLRSTSAYRPDSPPYCPSLCAVISLAIRLLIDHRSHLWWPRLSLMTHTAFPLWWDSNWCRSDFFILRNVQFGECATILESLYTQPDAISWPKCCWLVTILFSFLLFLFSFLRLFLVPFSNLFETNQNGNILILCSCSMIAMFVWRIIFRLSNYVCTSLFQHQQSYRIAQLLMNFIFLKQWPSCSFDSPCRVSLSPHKTPSLTHPNPVSIKTSSPISPFHQSKPLPICTPDISQIVPSQGKT